MNDQQTEPRQRRSWTAGEDSALYHEVRRVGIYDGISSDWNAVAAKFPRRTNKDCRKRWLKICKSVNKGLWSGDEDDRLLQAIEQYGQKWTEVARVVQTRHADQCAKRWHTVLCQGQEDMATWTDQDDEHLLQAVDLYGQKWKLIAENYFPGRSAAVVRSRYTCLTGLQPSADHDMLSPPAESSNDNIDPCLTMGDDFNFDMGMMSDFDFVPGNINLDDILSDMLQTDADGKDYVEMVQDNGQQVLHPLTPPSSMPSPALSSSTSNTRQILDLRRDSAPTTLTLADVQPSTLYEVLNILMRDKVKVSVAINGS